MGSGGYCEQRINSVGGADDVSYPTTSLHNTWLEQLDSPLSGTAADGVHAWVLGPHVLSGESSER